MAMMIATANSKEYLGSIPSCGEGRRCNDENGRNPPKNEIFANHNITAHINEQKFEE
jgi:hypothetical protein